MSHQLVTFGVIHLPHGELHENGAGVMSLRFFMLTLRDQNQRPFHVPRKGGLPRETVHGGIERRFTVGDVE